MRKRIASPDAPFQRAETVARMTGIPISHIRNGVKDGSIPVCGSERPVWSTCPPISVSWA